MKFSDCFSTIYRLRALFAVVAMCLAVSAMTSCIEDGFSSSPSDRPLFSMDTIDMGTVITGEVSMTRRFTVRNPNSKGLIISDIRVEGSNAGCFRLNVDGFSGETFSNVEIRANDSIYIFVSTTLPTNNVDVPVDVDAKIAFTTNGGTDHVVLRATGQDVTRLNGHVVDGDEVFDSARPYQVFDSLIVAPGARLTIAPGTSLMFHDKAYMRVYGALVCNGTVERPVEMRGDRTGDVIAGITFDLMAGQWQGIHVMPGSTGNVLNNTVIRNTVVGLVAESTDLRLVNSRLRNSQNYVLDAKDTDITAVGCEFGEASMGLVLVDGGKAAFDHCTFANYYLFSAIYGPALQFMHLNAESQTEGGEGRPYTEARVTNSILYGLGTDIAPGTLDGTQVYLENCLLKSNGSDDEHFVNCLWNDDPLYYTVREDYLFDYRLKPESPAIGAGKASLSTDPAAATDGYGLVRGDKPDLGAYVFVAPKE